MSFFSKNIDDALDRAREDERKQCDKDKENELEKQKIEIEGVWSLAVRERDSKINSLKIRIDELSKRESDVRKERQKLRQQAMLIRQVMSDLQYLSDHNKEENLERGQTIDRLMQEAGDIEAKLISN